MRTRINNWIDTETTSDDSDVPYQMLYGIDVSFDGKRWSHLAIDGNPYFAKTEAEREDMRSRLRRIRETDSPTRMSEIVRHG